MLDQTEGEGLDQGRPNLRRCQLFDRFETDEIAELDRQADVWEHDRRAIDRSASVLGSIDIPGIKRLMGRVRLDGLDDLAPLEQALEAFEHARSILRERIGWVGDKLAEAGGQDRIRSSPSA